MATNVHFVFSTPPREMAFEDYSDWYAGHVADVLAGPGFTAARRYRVEGARGERPPTMYQHLSLYQVEGDGTQALAELERRVQSGDVPLPDWFGDIRFASFEGLALAAPPAKPVVGDAQLPDHAYLVFSKPPAGMAFEDFSEWYAVHMRENLTADGFDAAWRFALKPATVDPEAPCEAVHGAWYAVHGELPELRAALKEAADAGRVDFPEWFGDIQFASVDCVAL
jgi:hypothetical protein